MTPFTHFEADIIFTTCTFLAELHPFLSSPRAIHHPIGTMVGRTSSGADLGYTRDAVAAHTIIATLELA